jgi:hypothetical protein
MLDLVSNDTQSYDIGKQLIINAIKIDETLNEILKLEIRKVRKSLNTDNEVDSINALSKTLRNVIIALTLTEEKIKTGMSFWNTDSKDNEVSK